MTKKKPKYPDRAPLILSWEELLHLMSSTADRIRELDPLKPSSIAGKAKLAMLRGLAKKLSRI